MRNTLGTMLVAGLLLGPAPLYGQKLEVTSGPVKVSFSGRVQFQFNTTSVDAEAAGTATGPAGSTFETRRVRAAVELTIADWIRGTIEPDFAGGRVQLRQAWMDLEFSDAFALRAGQFKKPFSLIQLTSSSKIPMIERNVRIRGLADAIENAAVPGVPGEFRGTALLGEQQLLLEALGYDSYDMGAAVHGQLGAFGYEAGVFNGTGADRADENGAKSFAARATYRLSAGVPFTVGAGASLRDHVADGETERGSAFEVDAELGEYRKPGVWLLAEAALGDNLVGGDFRGAQAAATYFVKTAGRVEGVEPMFRASWGDPDTAVEGDAGLLLTPGINLHFLGRNKLMLNWDWYLPQGNAFSNEHALRTQIQLYY